MPAAAKLAGKCRPDAQSFSRRRPDAQSFSRRRHGDAECFTAAGGTATPGIGDKAIILAYHAVFTTYGTWLPNDPRGSYSRAVYRAELAELGPILYGRQSPQPDRTRMRRFRTEAMRRLTRPPFYLDDQTRPTVAAAFASVASRLAVRVLACAIMNDHVHLVVLRSDYRIEYLVNQFKGAATKSLGVAWTPWTRGSWNVYIDDDEALWGGRRVRQCKPSGRGPQAAAMGVCDPVGGSAVGRRAGGR